MKKEKSCGCIVVKDDEVLLVRNEAGHWLLPKGHVEAGETEQETAIREVKEETNIDVEIISDNRYLITYQSKEDYIKDVVYFIARPKSNKIIVQDHEVVEAKYFKLDDAMGMFIYDDLKKMYKEFLNDYNNFNI
ncbi:MAG: NUDIX domain-containing protein [Mollicutes bacterium]|jgi:ADP-ribose pyrophosphatase YjhB (NUDIX family)|nr:NUDIX domain-containing protein [Mollicutes bacterium]